MNQGQLKKEFTKKDVTRMRNLITGKLDTKKNKKIINKETFGKILVEKAGLLRTESKELLQR